MISKYFKMRNIQRWLDVYLRHRQVELTLANLSFSQYGEDLYVFNLLEKKENGFYIDVGAFHPIAISNTHLLYKAGWRGINIEPNPAVLSEFNRYRPRDINLSCAVGTQKGDINLTLEGVFSRTTDEVSPGTRSIVVPVRRLDDIFSSHANGRIIDLMSVDCEGNDIDVLKSNDWKLYRPRVLLVEAINSESNERVDAFCQSLGYKKNSRLNITNVYCDSLFFEP